MEFSIHCPVFGMQEIRIILEVEINNVHISRNWQHKDVYSKRTENQHHTSILEANYYLSVYNVYFNLTSSTEQKILFSLIQSKKIYRPQFCDTFLFVHDD